MKAIVIKNNNFETIGFEVTAAGKTIFTWGVSSYLKSNFQKEIYVNDWITDIFELVRTQARLAEEREFMRKWFDVARNNKLLKEGKAVDFKENQEYLKSLESRIENIVKNII